ncbi:MAG: HEPN domain-containing protein [Chloroflexi bacterium]|nr:HEPN domain-containing protein [Chloroflexota bacterium]
MADEALGDAEYLLQDNRLKAAANRAYYAMFHAVEAAVATSEVKTPKTHGGAINLFGRHFIRTGIMERRFAKDLQDAYDLRQQSDY